MNFYLSSFSSFIDETIIWTTFRKIDVANRGLPGGDVDWRGQDSNALTPG